MTRHTTARACAVALCILSLSACKTPAPAGSGDGTDTKTSGAEAAAAAKGPVTVALVYIPGKITGIGQVPEPGETVWYSISGETLTKVAGVEGRVVASRSGKLWRVGVKTSEVDMLACEIDQDEGADSPTLVPVRLNEPTIAPLGGEARPIASALDEGDDPKTTGAFETNVDHAYQLGDFVFINVGSYSECGAHPNYSLESLVVSLEDGSIQPLASFNEKLDGLDDERAAAFAAMNPDLVMDEASALVPTVFSVKIADGAPKLEVQMTSGTAYVSHDGSWDSYSMSKVVDVEGGAPAPIASALEVPAPLLEMFVQQGNYLDHSVFEVSAAKSAELLAAFKGED